MGLHRVYTPILLCALAIVIAHPTQAQLIDSFNDGDFTSTPTWNGDTGSWMIVDDATSGPDATNSNTLRLNVSPGPSDTQYLSTQRTASWGAEQSWGFWLGRRSGASASTGNTSYVWLYANESNLESATIDGYRIRFGDNSGGDEIVLERVDDGNATAILTSSGSVAVGIDNIAFLVRVTRTDASEWTLFTSTLPTAKGEGVSAHSVPSTSNTAVNQGSTTDPTYTTFTNGYFGFMATHTASEVFRRGAEFDQLYFDSDASATLPVELTAFTALADGRAVVLQWETASETNNAGFEIQRTAAVAPSYETAQPWETLAFVEGYGTTEQPRSYTYRAEGLSPGRHRLRLKQIDYDGTFAYSPEVEVALAVPGAYHLSNAYPNPFHTTMSFSLSVARAQRVEVTVHDVRGRRVARLFDGPMGAGATRAVTWASGVLPGRLPGGLYLIRIRGEYFTTGQAVVLVK